MLQQPSAPHWHVDVRLGSERLGASFALQMRAVSVARKLVHEAITAGAAWRHEPATADAPETYYVESGAETLLTVAIGRCVEPHPVTFP